MVDLLPSVVIRAPINDYSKKLLLSALRDDSFTEKISLSESDVRRILKAISEESPTAEAMALSVCQKLYRLLSLSAKTEERISFLSEEENA